jgi:hypothetical protein
MEHVVGLFHKEMAFLLGDGFGVNTGYYAVQPVIRGTFYSPNDKFDKAKHSLNLDFNMGALLRKELSAAEVQIMGAADTGAFIAQVIDVKSGSVNDLITTNRNLRILGSKIKIAGDSDDIGVYFVPQDGGERVMVDASDIVTNNPSELMVHTPALPAGAYAVEVVTQYTHGKIPLKEPRSVLFDKILTVA